MNIRETYRCLMSAYTCRKDIVPLLIGPPGIGKTQAVYKLAGDLGVNVVEINANQAMPSEVSGMAMPDHDSKVMQYYDDSLLLSLKDGDILFFDEVLTAPAVVLNAFLKLLMDRRLRSGVKLPDVFIIAAGNVPKSGVREFTAPQLQRFQPMMMVWDSNEWRDYLVNRYGEERVPPSDSSNWDSLVCAIDAELTALNENKYDWDTLTPRKVVQYMDWCMEDGAAGLEAIWLMKHDACLNSFLDWVVNPRYTMQQQYEMKIEELEKIFDRSFSQLKPEELLGYAEEVLTEEAFEEFKKRLEETVVEV